MKTPNVEHISLYSILIVTVTGWAVLVASLADRFIYPTIV